MAEGSDRRTEGEPDPLGGRLTPMPHDPDVRSTSHDPHDAHDPILVAALAAGDLAGTDRDLALDRTRTCADCRTLHDDLVALARATASAAPPIATRPRDFRLTPADAARLRPMGWRRLVAAFSAPRLTVARPLGIGLTTLGLAGLLIGNVQLAPGGSAAGPVPATTEGSTDMRSAASAPTASGAIGTVEILVPGGAAASALPAASGVSGLENPDPSGAETYSESSQAPTTVGAPEIGDQSATKASADGGAAPTGSAVDPLRPVNVLFGSAILLGLGLLVAARLRSRSTR